MAALSNKKSKIKTFKPHKIESQQFGISDQIYMSGIYECTECDFTITMNQHQPKLPPHECTQKNYKYEVLVISKN